MTDGALCLSWDDGHPLDRRIAEMMARAGLAGTFFVPLSNVEGRPVLNAEDLRALKDMGFEIGAHGIDHRRLTTLAPGEARRQIVDGKHQLEDLLGSPVDGICYPGGRHNRDLRNLVREAGFTYGRTTQMFRMSSGTDPFRLPTTLQLYRHDAAALARNWVRQGIGLDRLALATRVWHAQDMPGFIATLAEEVADAGAFLHLWGHSWEIDEIGGWDWLARIFSVLAENPRLRPVSCKDIAR